MKKLLFTLLFTSTLVACQSAPAPIARPAQPQIQRQSAPQSVAQKLFPEVLGHSWEYDVKKSPVNDPDVSYPGNYSLSIDKVKPGGGIELRAFNSFEGRYTFPTLVQTPSQVTLQDATFLGTGSEKVPGLSIDFIKTPLKVGSKWEDPNWIGKVKSLDTVQVPAGTFKAWRIEVIGTFERRYTAVGNYWFVPGKGMVKSDLTTPGWHVSSVLTYTGPKR